MSVPEPLESTKYTNDLANDYKPPLQVESSVMRLPEVHGGNGYAAANVGDLGYEPTLGATSADAKPVRKRTYDRGGRGPVCGGCFPQRGF